MVLHNFRVGDVVAIQYDDITEQEDVPEQELKEQLPLRFTAYGKILCYNDLTVTIMLVEDHSKDSHHVYFIPIGTIRGEVKVLQNGGSDND